ncbi:MAG: IS256 family transposase, partial [Moorellales bacterium]
MPERVEVALGGLLGAAKEGLLAFSVAVGLEVLRAMMEAEVTELVGPRGKHLSERWAWRHGSERGSVVLGGRKTAVRRPRVRTKDGREVRLKTYEAFQDESLFTQACFERLLYGLSCRNYQVGLEAVGSEVMACGTARSSISRRFSVLAGKALKELLNRPLKGERYLVLVLDGVAIAEHTVVVALGITAEGKKQVLGLWEGATENGAVCKALLADLIERGLEVDRGMLVVIDGSKALRAAVREVLGQAAVVQRCQVHKKRNVLEHLPDRERGSVARKLDAAWRQTDYNRALRMLKKLADE